MPNQCVHCSKMYEDDAEELLKGCSKCGSKFFFYINEEKMNKIKATEENALASDLSSKEKKQIEQDVRDIVGIEDEETPIILDFESVKIIKPGKYLLDIGNLFSKKRPLVYKLEDGKYIIDLASQMGEHARVP